MRTEQEVKAFRDALKQTCADEWALAILDWVLWSPPGILDAPVQKLRLNVRARKGLWRLNISSVRELLEKTSDDLLEAKNFGETALNNVREALEEHGLTLRGESPCSK